MSSEAFETLVVGQLSAIREEVRAGQEDHEARIRTLESERTKKTDRRASVVAAIVSVVAAAAVHLMGGCAQPSYPPLASESPAAFVRAHDSLVMVRTWLWLGSGSWIGPNEVMTAGHVCETDMPTEVVDAVDGKAHIMYIAVDLDLEPADVCVLRTMDPTDTHGAWLRLAANSPSQGDHVWYTGYPAGEYTVQDGRYLGKSDEGWAVAAIPGYYGASGSLLLNNDGDVIGVLHGVRNGQEMDYRQVIYFAPLTAARAALTLTLED